LTRWPDLFIVGAPKAGTTSLYEYLKKIPGIYMSPAKEPFYFCKNTIPNYSYAPQIRDKEKYLNLFKKVKDEKIVGEGSVWYLSDPDSPELIYQQIPHAKIIIMLRDPVERAFSHYLMHAARNLFKTSSFHEQLQQEEKNNVDLSIPNIRLRAGLYCDDIQRYLKTFGANQVKIIIFEEFIMDTKKAVKDVLKFLGINHELDDFKSEVYNPSAKPRPIVNYVLNIPAVNKLQHKLIPQYMQQYIKRKLFPHETEKPTMLEEDRNYLKNYYQNDVENLYNLLARPLPWKNF